MHADQAACILSAPANLFQRNADVLVAMMASGFITASPRRRPAA